MSRVERVLGVFNSYAELSQGWNPEEEDDYQDFVDAVGSALFTAERGDGAVPAELNPFENQPEGLNYADGWNACREAVAPLLRAPAEQGGRVDEYALGWKMAAQWAGRDDLIADIGSPAYEQDKAANRITAAALAQNTQGVPVAEIRRQFEGYLRRRFDSALLLRDDVLEAALKHIAPLYLHAERARVPQEWRSLLANLAAVVRVQNGNRHDDTSRLLDHADRLLAVTSQPEDAA